MDNFFRVLRIFFCVFLGVLLGMEWFAWVSGYGLNVSLFAVCSICLVVLLGYTVYDVVVYMDKYKQCKKKIDELEENYDYACEEIKHLKDYVEEDSLEISRLRKLLYY